MDRIQLAPLAHISLAVPLPVVGNSLSRVREEKTRVVDVVKHGSKVTIIVFVSKLPQGILVNILYSLLSRNAVVHSSQNVFVEVRKVSSIH